jgi:hypothetical protein
VRGHPRCECVVWELEGAEDDNTCAHRQDGNGEQARRQARRAKKDKVGSDQATGTVPTVNMSDVDSTVPTVNLTDVDLVF